MFWSSFLVSWLNPAENTDSSKLMETASNNLLFYDIDPFSPFMQGKLMVLDVC
jgi:hypothetical protein